MHERKHLRGTVTLLRKTCDKINASVCSMTFLNLGQCSQQRIRLETTGFCTINVYIRR